MSTLGGLSQTLDHVLGVSAPRGWELLVILFVVLLLFGARKLPDLANSVGRSLKEFRKGAEGAFDDEDPESSPTPDRDAER